ncbi:tetraacyldisaccharide 4'-kinase [Vibrio maerlii]|uniref:tetraacyldisaccharide 4'-kinase n=1 Tax=Vibrio maerlii TaxID=2231648 RepID=UPI000E3D89D1|nr:tetraacyldisaccharide 4'-kinase [Vibrio maerlii]
MIEKIWFDKHPAGILLWPLLWPLSRLFKRISEKRKSDFQNGIRPSYKADVPVIVVGNITAGGNGKTPMVVWLVEQLSKQGYKPGVVSRGYGGKAPNYPLLVTTSTPAEHCGDEPRLIHVRTGAPVAVDPVRSNAVKLLMEQGVDIVITDDGLQHYALQRDVEFVVVDGARRFGNQAYMPLGPLREGLERLNSVDFIVTNGGEPKSNELGFALHPDMAVNLKTGERKEVSSLGNLVAFAGIGHPPRFFSTLDELKADVIATHAFPDHQAYSLQDIEKIEQPNSQLIMTEKDAVKCDSFAKGNWWYVPVSANFSHADEQRILEKLNKVMEHYGSSTS